MEEGGKKRERERRDIVSPELFRGNTKHTLQDRKGARI